MAADKIPASEPKSAAAETLEIVKTVVLALLIALALRVILFQPNTIPSSSMEPNLLTGDYMLVSKFDYGWSRHSVPLSPPLPAGRLNGHLPQRGDVIVFRLPRDITQTYVKRLIGLPGDRIQVSGGQVSVNGRPIPQAADGRTRDPDSPEITVTRVWETLPDGRRYLTFDRGPDHDGDDTPEFIVPEGHVFAMGDNRDNSSDSRDPNGGVGFIPLENLVGRAEFIFFSVDNGGPNGPPFWHIWNWPAQIRWSRLFSGIT
jgi:signal peptidase I